MADSWVQTSHAPNLVPASCVREHNLFSIFGLQSSARDRKRTRKWAWHSVAVIWFERVACHRRVMRLEPKDHTHQVTSWCVITFTRWKSRNDLILADFNLAVGWSIRQTTKFSSYKIESTRSWNVEYSPWSKLKIRYTGHPRSKSTEKLEVCQAHTPVYIAQFVVLQSWLYTNSENL